MCSHTCSHQTYKIHEIHQIRQIHVLIVECCIREVTTNTLACMGSIEAKEGGGRGGSLVRTIREDKLRIHVHMSTM